MHLPLALSARLHWETSMSVFPSKVETSAAPVRKKVAEMLRNAIISGKLPGGRRLIERDMCEALGVSRPSVREALRELEMEGFVESIPNRGPVVTVITPKTAESIYQVRAALESLAASLFAERASDEEIIELEIYAESVRKAYAKGEVNELLAAKNAFYEVFWKGSGNDVISSVLRNVNARVNRLRHLTLSSPSRRQASLGEINAIIVAIKKRDSKTAAEAARIHVENAAFAALHSVKLNEDGEDEAFPGTQLEAKA
jgi:DNA-binding GntR family transcriptional regulator